MSISERDETAILVRKGLKIAGRHKLVMHEPWRGPKAGLEHGPRQFKWAGVWKGLIRWKGLAVHVPFGEAARDESVERITEWLNNHRGPAFAAGDFNELLAWVRKHIAEQAKAKATGFRIDVAVYKGMKLIKAVQLGKHGSDHHAILFVFERRNALGFKVRFTILIWNVEVGHDNASVNATVIELAKKHDVDMVLLSETYGKHFAAARRRGWRVIQRIKKATSKGKKKATKPKVKKPAKPKKAKHSPTATADHVIAVAKTQVGYHEGRDKNGNWNNQQKYSPAVPSLEWSQGQAWCATFVSWVAMTAGVASLFPRTASTDAAASWYQKRGRWSEYPAIGAQGFLAHNGDEFHTFIVAAFDETYIWTVEGNTNDNGSSQGDGVYALKRRRRDTVVEGYGYPAYPEGIVSADPAWKGKK